MEEKIIGYFMETDIWFQGKLQPPRKTPIISFGGVDLEEYSDEDDIQVLSIEGNWYTIKKKEILFE